MGNVCDGIKPLEHISCQLNDGHPGPSRNVDGANYLHLLSSDPSRHYSDLPSRIDRNITVRNTFLKGKRHLTKVIAETQETYTKELVHRRTDVSHEACYGYRTPRMSLITSGYLALPAAIARPLRAVSYNELGHDYRL
jgi:hypothetical protein